MVRIKTPGIITFSEYRHAKNASQLTIAEAIVCGYCQEPVEIERCGGENLLECKQHGTMRLELADDLMTFYLHRLNGRYLNEYPSDLVEKKGCPFCHGSLKIGINHIYETPPENKLLSYPLDCDSCEISFYVVGHNGELRFQPKPEHLHPDPDFQQDIEIPNDLETTSPQVEVSEPTLTDRVLPAIDAFDNKAETPPSQEAAPANANKRKHVKKQILRVLHLHGTLRRSEIQEHVDGNVVKPLRELVRDGLVVQPRRGYYSLP